MAWKWIPAQLDQYIGSTVYDISNISYTKFNNQLWIPGYYLGTGGDYPYVITHVNSWTYPSLASSNGWVVSRYPFWCFEMMAYDENGNELFNEPALLLPIDKNDPFDDSSPGYDGSSRFNSAQTLYGGKPVWWSNYELSYFNRSVALYYSTTEQAYIIAERVTNERDMGNILHEPSYAADSLKGGTVGEYFWKSSASFLDPSQGPYTFNLAGGVDSYEGIEGIRITRITVSLKADQFYTYSSPSSYQSLEQAPAGEYTNPVTNEKYYVGLAAFKDNNNHLWYAKKIGQVDNYGRSKEYWMCDEEGGYSTRLFKVRGGSTWETAGGNYDPYYVLDNGNDSLANESSLTLKRMEFVPDDPSKPRGKGQYVPVPEKNLTLTAGPRQLVTNEDTILMGEMSIWR